MFLIMVQLQRNLGEAPIKVILATLTIVTFTQHMLMITTSFLQSTISIKHMF